MLERADDAAARGVQPVAEVRGFANANDAFHQTASSPGGKGAQLAMRGALEMAGLDPAEIDAINAHGTATPNNDLTEAQAITAVFGNDIPSVSSTKGFTGHTLGAAGSVESVFSILSIQEQVVFPNLGWSEPMPELNFRPVTERTQKKINHVLSNSFGFGGNCASVIFSKV
jgi:3-oxoacyl-[acyl-carrier-protein] synthase-1